MKTICRAALVVLLAGLAVPPRTQAQQQRTDYGLATLPEFRVEANVVGGYIDEEERQGELGNRLSLKEAGIGFRQYVDPFFRLDVVISGEEEQEDDGVASEFGVEQALITWLGTPWRGEVRIGKFQTSFGEYNDDDPDEHPQVTAPEIILNYFGEDDGWLDTGINGNITFGTTVPQVFWLGVFNGENPIAFHGGTERKPVYFARYELFAELGQTTGFEFGTSYAQGKNLHPVEVEVGGEPTVFEVEGETRMHNVHLELDWAPARRYLYSGFSVLAEFFQQTREYEENDALTAAAEAEGLDTEIDETTSGYYVLAQWRFARNWGVSARYDSSPVLLAEIGEEGEEEADEEEEQAEPGAYTIYSDENITASSLMLSYYPSRFSAVRFQYSNKQFDDETWNEYWVQFLVLLGFERPDVF